MESHGFAMVSPLNSGFISMDEMYKFLTSVFKVVLTPAVIGAMNSMGVNVESAEDRLFGWFQAV